MATKAQLRERIAYLERQLALGPQYEFRTISVDFKNRLIEYDGRKITLAEDGPQVLQFPVLNAKPTIR